MTPKEPVVTHTFSTESDILGTTIANLVKYHKIITKYLTILV